MSARKILVVDDEIRILNFLVTKLNVSGYEVIVGKNGVEGLEQVKAQNPDMLVLDVLMPKMDGLQMLKEVRSFSNVPVILLTARLEETVATARQRTFALPPTLRRIPSSRETEWLGVPE